MPQESTRPVSKRDDYNYPVLGTNELCDLPVLSPSPLDYLVVTAELLSRSLVGVGQSLKLDVPTDHLLRKRVSAYIPLRVSTYDIRVYIDVSQTNLQ